MWARALFAVAFVAAATEATAHGSPWNRQTGAGSTCSSYLSCGACVADASCDWCDGGEGPCVVRPLSGSGSGTGFSGSSTGLSGSITGPQPGPQGPWPGPLALRQGGGPGGCMEFSNGGVCFSPRMCFSEMDGTGTRVTMEFDAPTNMGMRQLGEHFPCTALFNVTNLSFATRMPVDKPEDVHPSSLARYRRALDARQSFPTIANLGTGSYCRWTTERTCVAHLGSDHDLSPPDSQVNLVYPTPIWPAGIVINLQSIPASLPIAQPADMCSSGSPININSPPASSIVPSVARIDGPAVVGPCEDVLLDARSSQGPLPRFFNWASVAGPPGVAAAIRVQPNTPVLRLSPGDLDVGNSTTVQVVVCSSLGGCSAGTTHAVSRSPDAVPTISVLEPSPLVVSASRPVELTASVSASPCATGPQTVTVQWQHLPLRLQPNVLASLPPEETAVRTLRLPAGHLVPSTLPYRFVVTATAAGAQSLQAQSNPVDVLIVPERPRVVLSPGSRSEIKGATGDVILDVSGSYARSGSTAAGGPTGGALTVQWSCHGASSSEPYRLFQFGSCSSFGWPQADAALAQTATNMRIVLPYNATTPGRGQWSVFGLLANVSDPATGLWSSASHFVLFLSANATVQPFAPQNVAILGPAQGATSDRLVYRLVADNGGRPMSVSWTGPEPFTRPTGTTLTSGSQTGPGPGPGAGRRPGPGPGSGSNPPTSSIPVFGESAGGRRVFVVRAGTVLPGERFTVRVTATDVRSGNSTSAFLDVQVTRGPEGGSCTVTPSSGNAAETVFSVMCTSWSMPTATGTDDATISASFRPALRYEYAVSRTGGREWAPLGLAPLSSARLDTLLPSGTMSTLAQTLINDPTVQESVGGLDVVPTQPRVLLRVTVSDSTGQSTQSVILPVYVDQISRVQMILNGTLSHQAGLQYIESTTLQTTVGNASLIGDIAGEWRAAWSVMTSVNSYEKTLRDQVLPPGGARCQSEPLEALRAACLAVFERVNASADGNMGAGMIAHGLRSVSFAPIDPCLADRLLDLAEAVVLRRFGSLAAASTGPAGVSCDRMLDPRCVRSSAQAMSEREADAVVGMLGDVLASATSATTRATLFARIVPMLRTLSANLRNQRLCGESSSVVESSSVSVTSQSAQVPAAFAGEGAGVGVPVGVLGGSSSTNGTASVSSNVTVADSVLSDMCVGASLDSYSVSPFEGGLPTEGSGPDSLTGGTGQYGIMSNVSSIQLYNSTEGAGVDAVLVVRDVEEGVLVVLRALGFVYPTLAEARANAPTNETSTLRVASCWWRNETTNEWSRDGCTTVNVTVVRESGVDYSYILCNCTHLTSFSLLGQEVEFNPLTFTEFDFSADKWPIYLVVFGLLGLYGVLLVLAVRYDRRQVVLAVHTAEEEEWVAEKVQRQSVQPLTVMDKAAADSAVDASSASVQPPPPDGDEGNDDDDNRDDGGDDDPDDDGGDGDGNGESSSEEEDEGDMKRTRKAKPESSANMLQVPGLTPNMARRISNASSRSGSRQASPAGSRQGSRQGSPRASSSAGGGGSGVRFANVVLDAAANEKKKSAWLRRRKRKNSCRARALRRFKLGHQWLAIFYRRPYDPFSRPRRLTLLFIAIFGSLGLNALFFGPEDGVFLDVTDLDWPGVLVVGTISMIIMMPVTAVMFLFLARAMSEDARKAEEAHLRAERARLAKSQSLDAMSKMRFRKDLDKQAEDLQKKNRGRCYLPPWAAVMGWILAILILLFCAFVCLAYGLQFEREELDTWLAASMISVLADLFILQPLKVVFFFIPCIDVVFEGLC